MLWAILEGKPGDFNANGVLDLEPFFAAASKAGIYLIAVRTLIIWFDLLLTNYQRPGPYINAESYGGGFPGWVARLKAEARTRDPEWLHATDK